MAAKYRITPSGMDWWAVQEKRPIGWRTLASSFRTEAAAEQYINSRLADEAEEFMRRELESRRLESIKPREYP